ncbi:hypothetical protein RF11_11925 [Thelohanellus kitauei]|uniref:Uncharacterized protein n=1 Tax=Thelohanellus kitauei TaxID=669202 RepID=A0A0C2MP41_THEKT|nr:hypothetical protein RF11_11925 [Thelohanellus kitauei]
MILVNIQVWKNSESGFNSLIDEMNYSGWRMKYQSGKKPLEIKTCNIFYDKKWKPDEAEGRGSIFTKCESCTTLICTLIGAYQRCYPVSNGQTRDSERHKVCTSPCPLSKTRWSVVSGPNEHLFL